MSASLKLLLTTFFLLLNCDSLMGDDQHQEIPLWPEGAVPDEPDNIAVSYTHLTLPTNREV